MTLSSRVPIGTAMLIALLLFTCIVKAQVLQSSNAGGWEVKTLQSAILGEKRKINIRVPAGANKYDTYPVLYQLDGEAHTALVTGQIQYLSEGYKIMPKMIVVTIENTDRTRDLTPTHSIIGPNGKPDTTANAFGRTSGGGEKFLQFMKQELMPYVEANYPAAQFKVLSGHSLGGLIAVYCLVKHPEYFNAYFAISPSLQWDNQVMLAEVAKLSDIAGAKRFLFFSDANEDEAFHQNQLKLDSILKVKNIAGLQYKRLFYPEETHASEPVKAFYDAMKFIYPAWHLPYNSSAFKKTMSSKIIIDHHNQLSASYGYCVVPSYDDMNQLARFLRNDPNRINDAIELLQLNAVNYPTSTVVLETLGDTYVRKGDLSNAEAAYTKALQVDPSLAGIQQKLQALQLPRNEK